MSQTSRAELRRAADSRGTVSEDALVALSDGPMCQRLEAAMRALAAHRGPTSSTCPSDVARSVGGDRWRELMDDTRATARRLAAAGVVEITQRGSVVDPNDDWRGPIRIRITG
ncbi:DUF3253 domain-containing protein [Mycobacterium sp. G7A2]|uniref:DUF3253 domain-containing protein n=1 Tax=Mycobacterium sp. G7A2 TaxID=3317307 RepID=UPI0035A8D768